MMNYDNNVAFLGQWKCFQRVLFFLLFTSVVPNGIMTFYIVFVADTPDHHCRIPEVNLTQEWLNVTIPKEVVNGKLRLSKCSRYRLDVVRNLSDLGLVPGRDVNLTNLEQESCLDGWTYSKERYQSTIVTEFDLVCSDQWKTPLTSTIYLLGMFVGSLVSGPLSDRFGRKPLFFAMMAIRTFSLLIQVFSVSWIMFCIFYFTFGIGQIGCYISCFVLGIEIFTGKVRVLFSSFAINLSFAIGYMVLPLFAYFLRDWKSLLLAMFPIGCVCLFFWWFVPESPRWLLSQGRAAEAEAIVRKVAQMNKVVAPEVIFEEKTLTKEKKNTPGHHNILDLVKTQNIRNVTLIICLVWFTLRLGYYGLSLNTSQLHADPYISCFMSAAVEIPGYIVAWLALQYLRRRPVTILVFFTESLALLLIQLVPEHLSGLAVTLEMLGKFTFAAGICMMYVYGAEMYPTVLRTTATGACSLLSRAGSSLAPFFFNLGNSFEYLPYIILGSLTLATAIASFFLPETFGKHLPQSIEEMPKARGFKCPMQTKKDSSKAISESRL